MAHHRMDNGNAFGRANRTPPLTPVQQAEWAQIAAAQREWMRRHVLQLQDETYRRLVQAQNPYNAAMYQAQNYGRHSNPVTPGERPEPEDTTGLKLLDEFLTKRRSMRHGDERK